MPDLTFMPEAVRSALMPVIHIIAQQNIELAVHTLILLGAQSTGLGLADLMAIGSRARIGMLAAMHFFDYVRLEGRYSQAAVSLAETTRDPVLVARAMKIGVAYDAYLIDLYNFTPYQEMLLKVVAHHNEAISFPPVTTLEPCSEGAIRWAKELGSPLHYRPESPPSQVEPSKATITFEDKELISEEEAAAILSRPPKSLGNLRRAGQINRAAYVQNTPNGKVLYIKSVLQVMARNGTLIIMNHPSRRRSK